MLCDILPVKYFSLELISHNNMNKTEDNKNPAQHRRVTVVPDVVSNTRSLADFDNAPMLRAKFVFEWQDDLEISYEVISYRLDPGISANEGYGSTFGELLLYCQYNSSMVEQTVAVYRRSINYLIKEIVTLNIKELVKVILRGSESAPPIVRISRE